MVTILTFHTDQSDYSVDGNNFLVFFTGSHQGSISCRTIAIINDKMTEFPEDFTLSLVPQNPNTNTEPTRSQLTVTIEDDDSKIKGITCNNK